MRKDDDLVALSCSERPYGRVHYFRIYSSGNDIIVCVVLSSGRWPWLHDTITNRVYKNAIARTIEPNYEGRQLRI